MADLANSNALLSEEERKKQEQAGGQTDFTGTGTSGVVTGGSPAGGSTANGSAGSTQPWTNIQAYLGANKDNTSSANLLQNNVGSVLQSDQDRYKTESTKALSGAKEKADESKWVADNFNQNLSNPNANTTDYVNRAKGVLNTNYQAQPFSYAMSDDASKYGEALKNDDAFYNMQNDFYTKAAGGTLSSGQRALQTQFDTNNEELAGTRDKLLKQYSGFSDNLGNDISSINSTLGDYTNQYNTNKSNVDSSVRTNTTKANQDTLDANAMLNGGAKRTADDWYQGVVNDMNSGRQAHYADGRNVDSLYDALNYQNDYYNQMIADNTAKRDSSQNQWNFLKQFLS